LRERLPDGGVRFPGCFSDVAATLVKPIADRLMAVQEGVHITERLRSVNRSFQTVETALKFAGGCVELQECRVHGIVGPHRNERLGALPQPRERLTDGGVCLHGRFAKVSSALVKPVTERLVPVQEAVHGIERLCGVAGLADRHLQTVETALQLAGAGVELQQRRVQRTAAPRRNQGLGALPQPRDSTAHCAVCRLGRFANVVTALVQPFADRLVAVQEVVYTVKHLRSVASVADRPFQEVEAVFELLSVGVELQERRI